jgi:hypothetical protein
MILTSPSVILFIEPQNQASQIPVIDELTIKMFNAMSNHSVTGRVNGNAKFIKGVTTMGLHKCVCGKMSRSYDLLLESGQATNSLTTHYLAYHRNEVPEAEITKVQSLKSNHTLDPSDQGRFYSSI